MAGVAIKMEFKTEPLKRWLKRAQRTASGSIEMWDDIGEELVQAVQRNFDNEAAGDQPWKALTAAYARSRPQGKILTITSSLRNSVNHHAGSNAVVIGTNHPHAAIHQFGGRTKPTRIRPKHKKALYWPGAAHPVAAVNHPGSDIPARAFLAFTDGDWERVSRIIAEHLLGR